MQPKEGRKELAPREIKFRCRRLDTTIRERAGSSQVPREAQESERYPGLFFFVSLFLFIPNSRCNRRVFAPWKRRESPKVQNRERQPHNQLRLFVPLPEEKMAEVSFALLCPSRTAESHSQILISTLLFRNLMLAALVHCAPLLVAHASGSANSWRLPLESAISVISPRWPPSDEDQLGTISAT